MPDAVVTVQGEATRTVDPDRAGVSVTVHATGADAKAVHHHLAVASASVRGVLEGRAGVDRFATQRLHVAPVFAARSRTRITGYRGSFATSVEIDGFEALPELLQDLTALPDAQVDGPWWSLTDDHPAHRDARLAAVEDARRRAADYAAAVGARLGPVLEIDDTAGPRFAPRARFALAAGAEADSTPALDLQPETQTVTGQVTVRFALRDVPD